MSVDAPTIEVRRALTVMVALAALWVILAVARLGVTYHLAPFLVSAVPAAALGIEGTAQARRLSAMAAAGAVTGLAATLLLSAAGRLTGPSLLPFGGAAAEAVIFSAIGAAVGWAVGMWAQRKQR